MNISFDRQTRAYITFLLFTMALAAVCCLFICHRQNQLLKETLLVHDEAILSQLLEDGVPANLAADTVTSSLSTPEGASLMAKIGLTGDISLNTFPVLTRFSHSLRSSLALFLAGLALLLTTGTGLSCTIGNICTARPSRPETRRNTR